MPSRTARKPSCLRSWSISSWPASTPATAPARSRRSRFRRSISTRSTSIRSGSPWSLGVVGLMNIQYAIANDKVYVLEANPRASRTVPLVSKVTGVSMARIATR